MLTLTDTARLTDQVKKQILTSDILGEGLYWIQVEDDHGNTIGQPIEFVLRVDEGCLRLLNEESHCWTFPSYCSFRYVVGKGQVPYFYSDWYRGSSVTVVGFAISL